MLFDTITAISTGNLNVPISIIRISGSEAFDIAKKIFSGKVGADKTITYGFIKDGETKIDEVLISWFKGPNTFTGEDIVEINAHGGVVNTNKILKLILQNGARLAEKGEFSRRAFLNGKMDLIKAEAIHDLIFAKTEEQALLSVKKFDNETSRLIDELKTDILAIIATIETNIDYPEYDDIEILTEKELLPKLESVRVRIQEILDSSKSSRYIFEGINVAIVGEPNVGKSSLLNAILNEEKAIVTDIPGTTRDIVSGSIQIGQVLFKFNDTAGIRESIDKVEKIGIEKSLSEIKNADLVIHIINPENGMSDNDQNIVKLVENKNYIRVYNKNDIKKIDGEISISVKNKDLKQLFDAIKKEFGSINLNDEKIINNTRQLSLIETANSAINEAISSLKDGQTPDIVIIDIHKAWEDLTNIIGNAQETDLLDEMFKSFCLGK